MLKNISSEKNKSLILELSEGQDVGTIGGYCEDGFPIYYANAKMAHMLGYDDVNDLIAGINGMVSNTIHPDDMDRVVRELNNGNFYEGMTYKVTYRMPKKDGSSIWTVDKGKVIRAEDGRLAILSICNDMTEFIDRHAELERMNQFSKSTLGNMPGGYHRCAAEEGYPFLYVSDRFCEMFGWTREEIKSKFDNKFINMLRPEDTETLVEYVEMLRQSSNENVVDAIYRMRGKNGYIWVSDSTSLVTVGDETFYQGTLTDITNFVVKRRSQDELLREQLMVFDTLARNFKNVYFVDLDKKTARILKLDADYVDVPGKSDHHEFPFEAALGHWINTNVLQEDRDKVSRAISIDNVKKTFETQDEFVGNYRSMVDGEIRNYQYSFSKVGEDGMKAILGFQSIDDIIEEHLESEKAEKEKEALHRKEVDEQLAIIDTLSRSFRNVFVANLEDGTARAIRLADSYRVKAVRDVEQTVFSFDAVVDRWVRETVHPDDKAKMKECLTIQNLREVLSEQDEFIGNYRNIEDGVLHYYQYDFRRIGDTDNVVAGFQIIDSIIEEQESKQKREKELEEARLREEREHIEVVNSLSTIYSTIFRADIVTHDYEILNSVPLMGTVATSKGNFDDVKDIIIQSFMEPEFREPLSEFLDLSTLADRFENTNTVTVDYKAPTGQWMQARFIAKRRDENGRAVETLYVARDITEEKNKELKQQEALTQALAAAQQANKAKTTFLNNMSHDIRTPMNAIIGFTALAQTHLDNHDQVEDYLSKISTSSNHLLSLINDILDMSRIESGTVKLDEKAVHIPDMLHDLRTMIQSLVNSKNLNLFIDTQDVVHEDVLTDKLRLNQVLLNIVGNAIKFTQPGGDIIIRLIEKPCSLKHYTTYEFSVKDNGIGMSQEFVGHIFDTFSREFSSTVSGIQGTGLGMAITKNIVDMMGGDIQVESEEGKGSLFTVTLNLRLANEPIQMEPIKELLGARALIVDDDMNTCRSVSKMLRDIQMRPDWTTSAKEAIVHAQDASETKDEYKVYIIDYLMPDMNGIETVRRIRKVISEDVPIIVLTAYDWADFEHEAREAGVTAFVSKPIFMSELREVLTQPVMGEKITKKEAKEKKCDYSGKHVLLVEDNELNREIATALLEEIGMTIDSVEDGDVAVATINRKPADKYDLILMDVQMPRMDGYTATREIRTLQDNRKANIPIVAMTANAFEEDRKMAFESGMNGHIIKPISIEEIAKVLDKIFDDKK